MRLEPCVPPWGLPSGLGHNLQIPEVQVQGFQNTSFLRTSTYKNALQASKVLQPYFKASKGISCTSLCHGILTRFAVEVFFLRFAQCKKAKNSYRWATYEGNFSSVLNQEFLFFDSRVAVFTSNPSHVEYWLLRAFSTRKPCAKAVPETDYFMQWKQYNKRTTLRTWTSQSQERDAERSAPTIVHLIHGASVLLGT